MPRALQAVMIVFPSTHFVCFAQAILYRGAGLDTVKVRLRGDGRDRAGGAGGGPAALPRHPGRRPIMSRAPSV